MRNSMNNGRLTWPVEALFSECWSRKTSTSNLILNSERMSDFRIWLFSLEIAEMVNISDYWLKSRIHKKRLTSTTFCFSQQQLVVKWPALLGQIVFKTQIVTLSMLRDIEQASRFVQVQMRWGRISKRVHLNVVLYSRQWSGYSIQC